MDHKAIIWVKPLGQEMVRESPDTEVLVELCQPQMEDVIIAELLCDDTDAWFLPLAGRFPGGRRLPEPAHVDACLDKGNDEGVVVDAVTCKDDVKVARGTQTRGDGIGLPVQRGEDDVAPLGWWTGGPTGTSRGGGGRVLGEVEGYQLLDVGLVGENVMGDVGPQGQGVQGADAAAEFEDGGGERVEEAEEGAGGGRYVGGEWRGDFPEHLSFLRFSSFFW